MKNSGILKKSRIVAVAIGTAFALSLTGCGGSYSDTARAEKTLGSRYANTKEAVATEAMATGDYGYDMYEAEEAFAEEYAESPSGSANGSADNSAGNYNDSARKLIKTYNLSVETEEFEQFNQFIQNKIKELSGYIQDMNEYNGSSFARQKERKYSNLTIRIPVDRVDDFLQIVGDKANIINQSVGVEDVTMNYVDTETRKKSLEIEQQRLLEFMSQAETVEDMLNIEERLADVRYRIESLTSTLKTYDNLVEYTTIYMSIDEVEEYTEPEPETFGDQISSAFSSGWEHLVDFLQAFAVFFIEALPILLLLGVIALIIVIIIRTCIKSARKKAAKRLAAQQNAPDMMQQNAQGIAQQTTMDMSQQNVQNIVLQDTQSVEMDGQAASVENTENQ